MLASRTHPPRFDDVGEKLERFIQKYWDTHHLPIAYRHCFPASLAKIPRTQRDAFIEYMQDARKVCIEIEPRRCGRYCFPDPTRNNIDVELAMIELAQFLRQMRAESKQDQRRIAKAEKAGV